MWHFLSLQAAMRLSFFEGSALGVQPRALLLLGLKQLSYILNQGCLPLVKAVIQAYA